MSKLDAQSIINYIGNAPKKTTDKAYIKGKLENIHFPQEIQDFDNDQRRVIYGGRQVGS